MSRLMKALLIGSAALAIAGPAGAVELIVNGGFNNGGTVAEPTGGFATLGVGNTSINAWDIDAGTIDWIQGYWQSADGDGYSVDLNGNSPASISQSISTLAGQSYILRFAMSGNPDNFRGETRVAVIGADGTIGSATYTLTAANTRANMLWAEQTFGFTATDSSTIISFTSGNTGPN